MLCTPAWPGRQIIKHDRQPGKRHAPPPSRRRSSQPAAESSRISRSIIATSLRAGPTWHRAMVGTTQPAVPPARSVARTAPPSGSRGGHWNRPRRRNRGSCAASTAQPRDLCRESRVSLPAGDRVVVHVQVCAPIATLPSPRPPSIASRQAGRRSRRGWDVRADFRGSWVQHGRRSGERSEEDRSVSPAHSPERRRCLHHRAKLGLFRTSICTTSSMAHSGTILAHSGTFDLVQRTDGWHILAHSHSTDGTLWHVRTSTDGTSGHTASTAGQRDWADVGDP